MMIQPLKFGKGKGKIAKATPAAVPRKKKRLTYIAVLPSFITLMNGVCGFSAIIFASRTQGLRWNLFYAIDFNMTSFALAGYMILLAMVADMLDGRIARLTRTTSSFGGQLDSLSDAVSFGIAPAFLMIKMVEFQMEHTRFEVLAISEFVEKGIFFSAVLYAMCALVRLARFNVENEEDESAHMHFAGIPSPAAAGVVVSLVIFHQHFFAGTTMPGEIGIFNLVVIIAFPLITLLTGILMVTRIRYPHAANQLIRSKKPLPVFLAVSASGLLIVWNLQLALVVGFCGFALFGVFRWIFEGLFKKRLDSKSSLADQAE